MPFSGVTKWLRTLDWPLLAPLLILIGIGIASIHSATGGGGGSGGLSSEAQSQLVFCAFGFVGVVIISRFQLTTFSRMGPYGYVGVVLALVLVLVMAPTIAGVKRWLVFGSFRMQPSELAKVALVMVLAKVFQGVSPFETLRVGKLALASLIIGVPTLLVLVEPNLGSATLIFGIGVAMVLLCRIHRYLLLGSLTVVLVSAPLFYQFGLKPYQRERVMNFLNPNQDHQGAGYNAIQSIIAIGSGQVTGKGYLQGSQAHLDFIPEQHTDFIFSAFAEEWGFLGVLVVMLLYAWICWRMYQLAKDGPDPFATLFCLGYAMALAMQVVVNVAMVSGLLPVVGVPLPFMSYGGSSLLSNLVAIGMCLAIRRQQHLFEAPEL